MEPLIFGVEGLCVERDRSILQDITWQVHRGEHWVILGANGSGKTSLLRALTGYLMPTSGTVRVGAAVFGAKDWREVRRIIGLVSSSLGQQIEPDQRAWEVVLSGVDAQINFHARATEKQRAWTQRLLKKIRAEALADRLWQHLSQGERQRLLIGRALAGQPKILFLDEPCAGLDPVAREDFLHFLSALARTPRAPSLVLVTHHVEEILPEMQHLLLLRQGKVLAQGPRQTVLTSEHLTDAFGANIELFPASDGERYRLSINPSRSSFSAPARHT